MFSIISSSLQNSAFCQFFFTGMRKQPPPCVLAHQRFPAACIIGESNRDKIARSFPVKPGVLYGIT